MYINFKLLEAKGLSPSDFIVLQMCRQQKNEDLSKNLEAFVKDEEILLSFEADGLIQQVKGSKKDNFFRKFRTTKKGNELLDDLESFDVLEEDLVIFNWIAGIYKKRDKSIGNATKAKSYIASFRTLTGITKNKLAFLLTKFINDETSQQYSQQVDYIFFKPPNVFTTRFSLGESKLYKFYEKHKEYFDSEFLRIEKEDKTKVEKL